MLRRQSLPANITANRLFNMLIIVSLPNFGNLVCTRVGILRVHTPYHQAAFRRTIFALNAHTGLPAAGITGHTDAGSQDLPVFLVRVRVRICFHRDLLILLPFSPLERLQKL